MGLQTLLSIALYLALLPHLISVSISINFFILFVFTWFVLHTQGILTRPGRFLQFILVLIGLAILLLNYGFLFSQKAALSLLAIMLCLKCLEIKNELDRRNVFVIIFLSYFYLITYFIHSQDFFLILFVLVNFIILTLILFAFNRKPQATLNFSENLHFLFKLLIKAIPIAIILFLFFPRIPGPLWSLPDDGQSGKTGLSDKMFPGSVTSLADSDEIAFRVDFAAPPPIASKLYWRGPVLSQTDGFLWSQKEQSPLNKSFNEVVSQINDFISYTVTLEAHKQKWLFALEMPSQVKGDTIQGHYLSTDLQLLSKNKLYQLTQYQVTSATTFKLNVVTKNEIQEALFFPKESNPKTFQLGQKWKNKFSNHQLIVSTGLNYFRNQPFFYTKKPNTMIENPSDQFLFDEKRGFCEHYASSFVLLMRAAGVPARVVTGYQGIEKNDVGEYYVVRQSSAHAWAEVWLQEDGWKRVDPTSMIPPSRVEANIFQTNLERLSFSSLNLPDLPELTAKQKTRLYNLSQKIKQSIDSIKHQWNTWILGYDQTKQNLLLKLMGLSSGWQTLIFVLIGSLTVLLIIFQAIQYHHRHKQTDKVYLAYIKFINKLNQAGLQVALSDGPESVKKKAVNYFPVQREVLIRIVDHYIQIRYADKQETISTTQFISLVKQLKC